MNIRITSWNTFGSSISKISEVSGELIANDRRDILLVQEAGATDSECKQLTGSKDISFGKKNFKCLFKDDLNARNKRCTTGILVEEALFYEAAVGLEALQITGVNRPVVFGTFQFNMNRSLYVATLHATACSAVSKKEIDIINNTFSQIKKKTDWQWILMGDFNVEPEELMRTGMPNQNIIHPNESTHICFDDTSKNAILDYAIVSDGLTDLSVYCGQCSGTSDHIPVYIDLPID